MKKKNWFYFRLSVGLLILFVFYTLAVMYVDVKSIGPLDSYVGFSTLNHGVHNQLGTHLNLYQVTDWLSLIPVAIALGFAILGLIQLVKRKNIFKVDSDLLVLGLYYFLLAGTYLFFELIVINYRPILIDGVLEASYPSSTTLLVLAIMPTAMLQFQHRIKKPVLKKWTLIVSGVFTCCMVIGRIVSGVHWISDIIGGVLISATLVMTYQTAYLYVQSESFQKWIKKGTE